MSDDPGGIEDFAKHLREEARALRASSHALSLAAKATEQAAEAAEMAAHKATDLISVIRLRSDMLIKLWKEFKNSKQHGLP